MNEEKVDDTSKGESQPFQKEEQTDKNKEQTEGKSEDQDKNSNKEKEEQAKAETEIDEKQVNNKENKESYLKPSFVNNEQVVY